MNIAHILGHVGSFELRASAQGTPVLNIRVATSERVKKHGEWTDETEWHSVIVWGKRADSLGKILNKGDRLCVTGRMKTTRWKDKDEQEHSKTEIVASSVELAGKPKAK